jgi:hypothetical protein
MIGGYARDIKRGNTTYFGVYWASFNDTATTIESETILSIPLNCTISNLYVYLSANAGGAGTSYTFVIRKNNVNTAVATTITGATSSGSDTVNTATFASGDIFSIAAVPSATQPTDNLEVRWSCRITSS